MTANNKQIGGNHYKSTMECWDYIVANDLGFLEGTAIKYITRWRKKNGIEDIKKAIHVLEKLVEIHTSVPDPKPSIMDVRLKPSSVGLKPMDVSNCERLYDPAKAFEQPRNSYEPIPDGESLDQWVQKCAAQKALDDYHARDV
jgi:hypothetical protein